LENGLKKARRICRTKKKMFYMKNIFPVLGGIFQVPLQWTAFCQGVSSKWYHRSLINFSYRTPVFRKPPVKLKIWERYFIPLPQDLKGRKERVSLAVSLQIMYHAVTVCASFSLAPPSF